jgi:hypothetical protein
MEAWASGNDDVPMNHSSGGAGQKKRDCNPNTSNDYKRKQFSEGGFASLLEPVLGTPDPMCHRRIRQSRNNTPTR